MGTIASAFRKCDKVKQLPRTSALENAIAEVIKEGKVRTYDMGGSSSTLDVARAVSSKI